MTLGSVMLPRLVGMMPLGVMVPCLYGNERSVGRRRQRERTGQDTHHQD